MLETLKEYQLNIMLAFSMICGMLAFFVAITKPLSPSRKRILLSLELCSMFLLSFDRFAYFFRGKEDNTAFWMVRISNFMVYLLVLAVILIFTFYIIDFYCHEGGAESPPFRLKLACIMCVIGAVLLIISQFTLCADCRKGTRPSFSHAAKPDEANRLYELFLAQCRAVVPHVDCGVFGAHMDVDLRNDGPFTVMLDTDELKKPRHH